MKERYVVKKEEKHVFWLVVLIIDAVNIFYHWYNVWYYTVVLMMRKLVWSTLYGLNIESESRFLRRSKPVYKKTGVKYYHTDL